MDVPILSALAGSIGSYIAAQANWQECIVKVMMVLPGKYRYSQVAAAVRASGVHPSDIYNCLAAQQNTFALQRFYEVLRSL